MRHVSPQQQNNKAASPPFASKSAAASTPRKRQKKPRIDPAVAAAGEAVMAEEAIRHELEELARKRQQRKRKSDLASAELMGELENCPMAERKKLLQGELHRARYVERYRRALRSTFFSLVVVAAVAVLVATLWLPVLQVYGNSMNPTLESGEVLISLRNGKYKTGEIIAFYYNNKVLIKRVIGNPGDWIDIDQDGNVKVNGNVLEEPYIQEKALGDCDIQLPYQVPEGRIFVMGDHRATSVDSRKEAIGCIADEQIVGRLIYRIWPLKSMGPIN